jgi:hypothetical protein
MHKFLGTAKTKGKLIIVIQNTPAIYPVPLSLIKSKLKYDIFLCTYRRKQPLLVGNGSVV